MTDDITTRDGEILIGDKTFTPVEGATFTVSEPEPEKPFRQGFA